MGKTVERAETPYLDMMTTKIAWAMQDEGSVSIFENKRYGIPDKILTQTLSGC